MRVTAVAILVVHLIYFLLFFFVAEVCQCL